MDGQVVRAPAVAVPEVVDPVGAGDAFNAGFLSSWLRGRDAAEALRFGNELGAEAVASPGENQPLALPVAVSRTIGRRDSAR